MRVALVCLSIFLILSGQSYAKIDNATIVAMWLFDEGSGKTVKDSSGNENNGTITGDSKWDTGKFGKALEFNGKILSLIVEWEPVLISLARRIFLYLSGRKLIVKV